MTKPSRQTDENQHIELKDPMLAAFLAWLIPGLGHLYQGRRAKAALFFVCIMSTFVYGLYLGGSNKDLGGGRTLGWGRVVYASWRTGDRRLPYLCQVGIGLPALPALVQADRAGDGKAPLWNGFMATPSLERQDFDQFGQPTLNTLHKQLHRFFELGTVYTMIAGLLNILAVYDAWGGPVFIETANEDKKDEGEDKSQDADS